MWLKDRVKAWLGPIWWYAAVMFVVQRIGDVINLYTGLWLIPKWVPQNELGALLPLTQVGAFLGLPLAIVLTPFTKFINTFSAKGEYGKVKALLTDALALAGVSSVVIAVYTWFSAPHVFQRLRIDQAGIVWLICMLSVGSVLMPIFNSALQALKRFRCVSVIGLTAAPARLVVLFLLLPVSGLLGYFASQVVLYLVMIGIAVWGLRKALSGAIRRDSYAGHGREMFFYTIPISGLMVVGTVATMVQFFVIRQRLPDVESAAFYFNSRFAEIPSMLWSAVSVAFFPVVSEAFEVGKNTSKMLAQSLAFTVLGGGVVAAVLGAGCGYLFVWVKQWNVYQPYAYLIVWMALMNVFRAAFACFSTYEMACRRFGFIGYSVPLSVLEFVALLALTGYGLFAPYLPKVWIDWVASLRAARLEFIVGVMLASSMAQFLGVLLHIGIRSVRARTGRAVGASA